MLHHPRYEGGGGGVSSVLSPAGPLSAARTISLMTMSEPVDDACCHEDLQVLVRLRTLILYCLDCDLLWAHHGKDWVTYTAPKLFGVEADTSPF